VYLNDKPYKRGGRRLTVMWKEPLPEEFCESTVQPLDGKNIYILMGASGSGKTTVGNYLKELGVSEIISHTTRSKREGEVEGETYYYVSREEFEKIEKIEEVKYQNNLYCISKKEIENKFEANDKLFVICDVNGMEQVKNSYPKHVVVIYLYTSLEEMEKRMRVRGDSEENVQGRLDYAKVTNELENGKYADILIENKELHETMQQVKHIVFQ